MQASYLQHASEGNLSKKPTSIANGRYNLPPGVLVCIANFYADLSSPTKVSGWQSSRKNEVLMKQIWPNFRHWLFLFINYIEGAVKPAFACYSECSQTNSTLIALLQMSELACKESRAVASGGAGGARPLHLKSVPPHFRFGPPVAAHIQYCILKMCPPPSGFWPPCCYILATGLKESECDIPHQQQHGFLSFRTARSKVTKSRFSRAGAFAEDSLIRITRYYYCFKWQRELSTASGKIAEVRKHFTFSTCRGDSGRFCESIRKFLYDACPDNCCNVLKPWAHHMHFALPVTNFKWLGQ